MYNKILNLLHRFDKICLFVQDVVKAIADFLNIIDLKITNVYLNFFFSTLTTDGVEYFEKLLKITPLASQTIEDRRSAIRAKWLSKIHNSIGLIQVVCNSWKRGEVEADFVGGKIKLKFVGEYGIPDDVVSLISSVGEVKPAHIPLLLLYKYLLIKDIHEVKTVAQMEQLTINMFAFGIEE